MMTQTTMPSFESMRAAMVASQLRTSGVTDSRVLSAMGRVPREDYVPEGLRNLAYIDRSIALGDQKAINPPLVTALLLNAAVIREGDHVLLIGMATGYAEAVVRFLTDNITITEVNLSQGHAEGAPYDVIVVDGAVDHIPDALIDQLNIGGRLVSAVNQGGVSRLVLGTKTGKGFGTTAIADLDAVPLPGFAIPKEFQF